jgi:hypothetical protein
MDSAGATEGRAIPAFRVRASIAFEVDPVLRSGTIGPGLPGHAIDLASSRTTRAPVIDESTTAARHSFVTSPIVLRIRMRRPVTS